MLTREHGLSMPVLQFSSCRGYSRGKKIGDLFLRSPGRLLDLRLHDIIVAVKTFETLNLSANVGLYTEC